MDEARVVEFKALETFVWVVRLGSFVSAAGKLNTTQPAISQRIAQLEERIGTRLLMRSRSTVTPTPVGRELLAYAERLLALRAEMTARLQDRAAVRGILRIGVAETIVHTWLPVFLKEISAAYPGLSMEIDVDISPTLRTRLLSQEIDLAFLIGPLSASNVANLPLGTHPLAFVASPALGAPDAADLAELARFPILTFARGTRPYEIVRTLFQRPELPLVNLNASASLATIVRLAIEGLGVAVIPPAIVADDLTHGRLRVIRSDVALPALTFSATWIASPDAVAVAGVAEIAARIARQTASA